MVQRKRLENKLYKSVFKDHVIYGDAKKIAYKYEGLAKESDDWNKEAYLQHCDYWHRVNSGVE